MAHSIASSKTAGGDRAAEVDLVGEAIRRGVQYLAFKPHPFGLNAAYEPGPGQVNGYVARAAYAAQEAHKELAPDIPGGDALAARARAITLRRQFAQQLADVKAGRTRAPTTALRSAYLEALADFMIETVHSRGIAVLEAWAARHAPEAMAAPGAGQ